jgi:hypothetical protein
METTILKQLKEMDLKNLPKISTTTQGLVEKPDHCELSIFKGSISKAVMAEQLNRIKSHFPSVDEKYLTELKEDFIRYKFSNERIIESVDNVIRTCKYPSPLMSNFLTFDKIIKFYTYAQFSDKIINKDKTLYKTHTMVKLSCQENGVYVKNEDIDKYGLTLLKDYNKTKNCQN